jgi:outer membrane protein OmpA-like peptidoglycan-associated protein
MSGVGLNEGFWTRLLALFFGTVVAGSAWAQSTPPKVLDDNQVTEKALLDALTPSADELEGIRTRSLRVGPAGGGQVAGAQGAGAASAATGAIAAPAPRRDVSLLVTFVTNSTALTNRAQQLLDVVGRALKSDQLAALKFTVEGHADPRGNRQANLTLSQGRAESVRKYLIAAHGIEGARLFAVGKGDAELMNKAKPAAPENRRVTLVTRME